MNAGYLRSVYRNAVRQGKEPVYEVRFANGMKAVVELSVWQP